MKVVYRFRQLSRGTHEFHEAVLMEEIEVQVWYAVHFSVMMNDEVFMCIQ